MAKNHQKLFPNYSLNNKHIAVIKAYENTSGFEIMGGDDVTDIESFRDCIKHNLKWFHDLADETQKCVERTANKIGFELYNL